jgi:hypothetical protein
MVGRNNVESDVDGGASRSNEREFEAPVKADFPQDLRNGKTGVEGCTPSGQCSRSQNREGAGCYDVWRS